MYLVYGAGVVVALIAAALLLGFGVLVPVVIGLLAIGAYVGFAALRRRPDEGASPAAGEFRAAAPPESAETAERGGIWGEKSA